MKRIIVRLLFLISLPSLFAGCRTFNPPAGQENSQPWAQPAKWQETEGIPGFTSNTKGGADYGN